MRNGSSDQEEIRFADSGFANRNPNSAGSRPEDDRKSVYEETIKVKASDSDMYQRLRMSVLFRFLQEISIAHTEQLGFPRETTLDKGALWVIARIRVRLKRPLLYNEQIALRTWPGEMMHVLFPRYYRIFVKKEDGQLEKAGEGAAIWTLIDAGTREWIFPSKLGILIPGHIEGGELPLPGELEPFDTKTRADRKVGFSEVDLNGHVNNTKYLDWMDDLMDDAFYRDHFVRDLQVNFHREIRAGEMVQLRYLMKDNEFCMEGAVQGNRTFSLKCVL